MASSSWRSHAGIFSTLLRFLTALLVAFLAVPFVGWTASQANAGTPGVCDTNNLLGKVVGFEQNTQEDSGGTWINGALNQVNSNYAEGDYVPQRTTLTDVPAGENELVMTYDATKNGLHAYDFADFLAIDEPGATITWDAPAPTPPVPLPSYDNADGTATVVVHITFQVPQGTDGNMIISWAGHIAAELDYGPDSGAGTISGAPYHFSLETLNCASSGQKDNQLMADAVAAGHLTVIKDAQPDTATPFHFSITPGGAASDFDLVDNGDPSTATITYRVPPGVFNIAEVNLPAEWGLDNISCVNEGGNSSTTDVPGHTATATVVDDGTTTCTFVNKQFVPHWTLTKTSDKPTTVLPGDSITYTLHVHNDSQATVQSATVTDDLSAVLDDAAITSLGSGLVLNGTTLTWTVPTPLAPGASATVSYTVQVNAGAWNVDIDNLATPGPGGDCPTPADCTTHHETPPVTTFVVKKVDFETGAPLAGAHFILWIDNGTIGQLDPADVQVGDEEITGANGLASWDELLAGPYLIQETQAPPGYALPAVTVHAVTIETGEGARDWTLEPFIVEDPSVGHLAVVAKQQYEKNANGNWVLSDGVTDYGTQVKYIVRLEATGTKLFHNVKTTDWVPGFNPNDSHVFGDGSTMKATLVPGSAKCLGITCNISVSPGHLVTWAVPGTVKDQKWSVEMIVNFPKAPVPTPFDADGFFNSSLWNVGFLDYDEAVANTPGSRVLAKAATLHHVHLKSNEVVITATLVEPPPGIVPCTAHCLPNTGSSPYLLQLGGLGGLALLAGSALVIRGRRRQEPTA
jgi:uncharacterized repeat protein (TIGR01451 family)/LPXTG-motif cell wall-anchored protein